MTGMSQWIDPGSLGRIGWEAEELLFMQENRRNVWISAYM